MGEANLASAQCQTVMEHVLGLVDVTLESEEADFYPVAAVLTSQGMISPIMALDDSEGHDPGGAA